MKRQPVTVDARLPSCLPRSDGQVGVQNVQLAPQPLHARSARHPVAHSRFEYCDFFALEDLWGTHGKARQWECLTTVWHRRPLAPIRPADAEHCCEALSCWRSQWLTAVQALRSMMRQHYARPLQKMSIQQQHRTHPNPPGTRPHLHPAPNLDANTTQGPGTHCFCIVNCVAHRSHARVRHWVSQWCVPLPGTWHEKDGLTSSS